jgi:hypothetical protein
MHTEVSNKASIVECDNGRRKEEIFVSDDSDDVRNLRAGLHAILGRVTNQQNQVGAAFDYEVYV